MRWFSWEPDAFIKSAICDPWCSLFLPSVFTVNHQLSCSSVHVKASVLSLNTNLSFNMDAVFLWLCFYQYAVVPAFTEGKEFSACHTFVLQPTAPSLSNKKRVRLNGRMAPSFTLSDLLRKALTSNANLSDSGGKSWLHFRGWIGLWPGDLPLKNMENLPAQYVKGSMSFRNRTKEWWLNASDMWMSSERLWSCYKII